MSDFIWPSDLDCAENEELNRVCEQLEAVMDERDALAAYVETLKDALEDITQAAQQEGLHFSGWQEQVSNAVSAMLSSTASNLTRRDLLQRAEELEALAEHFMLGESHKRFTKRRAHQLRQQVEALNAQSPQA